MDKPNPRYIGENLTAEYDGVKIKLTLDDGLLITDEIVLDDAAMSTLLEYVKEVGMKL